ncbi:PRC-barrel domain-containing protein [Patescibacteria group bacterium]|nr:PRC-barrel domain-containing protein [Patescibacteria group bacterium]
MSVCSSSQARGLLVVTKSGQEIGHILGFVLDRERGAILQVEVRPAGFVRGLVAEELLIAWNDVIEWDDKRMLVKDLSVPIGAPVLSSAVPGL